MPKFFVSPSEIGEEIIVLRGDDAAHIAKTLRMRKGETLTICDGAGNDYLCCILSANPALVEVKIEESMPSPAEPKLDFTLCMALAKSDKLELVVQKAVELGAKRVCIFRSSFCVPDPDARAFEKRLARLSRIAREAAGQCGRGCVPQVEGLYGFDEMLSRMKDAALPLFFYEKGGTPLKTLLEEKSFSSCAVMIGPEGGFSAEEAQKAADAGIRTAHLGARILRCETAAICAVSTVMYAAGEME